MPLPTTHPRYSVLGFTISPSQSLTEGQKRDLDNDLVSLLSSLTYNPAHIQKTTLDLRYLTLNDSSLAGKHLDTILLVRINYDLGDTSIDFDDVASRFREDFYNLLALNLNPYEFRTGMLSSKQVSSCLDPFPIADTVEITRSIARYKPFQMRLFEGRSPMTKIVDMLLLERGQRCLSILIEPYRMTEEEQSKIEVFGYETKILPSNPDKELIQGILGFQAQSQSMRASFRMKLRLLGDNGISQYLVNLVGSEISGQQDFFYFRPEDENLKQEIDRFKTIEFDSNLADVIKLDIPDVLLDLVYLFRPAEVSTAFRLPSERISSSKERLFKTHFAPLASLPEEGLLMGTGEHPSHQDPIPIYIRPKDRGKHCYIIGKTGTGKSMMLLGMIKQDIQSNRGVCLIDPHGDLVESVFACIPEERKEDVYLFDPSDDEYVMGLNFLEATSAAPESERDYLLQEVISMLLRTVDYDLGMFGPRAQQWGSDD